MIGPLLPLIVIAPLLVAVAWGDLRHMRIPNPLVLAVVAVFALMALIDPPADLLGRVAVALAVLALGFAAFCLRLFGGGDVKMLAALMLFVPVSTLLLFSWVFVAAMLAGIALILGLRQSGRVTARAAAAGWKTFSGQSNRLNRFPMGISIALAGLLHPVVVTVLAAG